MKPFARLWPRRCLSMSLQRSSSSSTLGPMQEAGSSFRLASSSSSSSKVSSLQGFFFFLSRGGEEILKVPSSLTAAGGWCTQSALECLAVLRCRQVDCSGAPGWLQGTLSSSPTCVVGPLGAFVLLPGVSSGVGASGGGLQDASKGGSGTCGPTRSGFLQLAVSCREGDGGWRGGGGTSLTC